MLNVSPAATRAASLAQASDQSPQTFNESLLAASKASSGTGTENQAGTGSGRRQKPVSEDAKLPPATPHVRRCPVAGASSADSAAASPGGSATAVVNPALIPMQLPFGEPGRSARTATVAAGQPMRDGAAVTFLPIESKIAQPVVAKSDSIPSSHAQKENDPPQAASILPLVPHVSQTAANLSNAVTNVVPNTVSSMLPNPLSTNANVFADAVQAVLPDAIQKAVPSAVSNAAPSAVPSVAPTALPSAVLTPVSITDLSAVPTPVPSAAPSVVSTAFRMLFRKRFQSRIASAVSSPVSSAAPSVVSSAIEKPLPGPILSTIPTACVWYVSEPRTPLLIPPRRQSRMTP